MPIYEYKCQKCNNKFSVLQSLYPESADTECPKCASKEVKKILSAFSCSGSGSESSSSHAASFGGGGG